MIELAQEKDVSEILGWACAMHSDQFNWGQDELAPVLRELTYVFRVQNEIAAFVSLKDLNQVWEILVLATKPRFREQGHMKELLKQVIFAAGQERGLWLEVHEMNTKARALYDSLGFRQVGLRKRYYKDGGSAVLYERTSR